MGSLEDCGGVQLPAAVPQHQGTNFFGIAEMQELNLKSIEFNVYGLIELKSSPFRDKN